MTRFNTLSLLLFATALFVHTYTAKAVKAYPRPVTYTQSDGTQIIVYIMGDEFKHRVLSQDGYTLTGGLNNDYYYATLSSDGNLVPTSVRARPFSQLSKAERVQVGTLRKGLEPTAVSRIAANPLRTAVMNPPASRASNGIKPPYKIVTGTTKGKLRSLVLLVESADKPFTVASPQQAFTAMLNQRGYRVNGATGSAWDYYNDNSNGQFDPEFIVTQPYRLSKTAKYYAGVNGTANAPDMVVEACRLADNDIDFSQFAGDDGVIRDVFVFYSGANSAEGAPNTIWPHRWSVNAKPEYQSVILDGVRLLGYACSSELSAGIMTHIGIFCHEFGHVLGWPDFYDTDGILGGDSPGLGIYSLMSEGSYNNNSRTPPATTLLERWMADWTEPVQITTSGAYLLGSICDNKGYYVGTPTDGEYFLFENRGTNKTVWDNPGYMGNGSGMIVYHIDATEGSRTIWTSNKINASPAHEYAKHVRHTSGLFHPQSGTGKLLPNENANYRAWNGLFPNVTFPQITREGDGSIKLVASGTDLTTEVNQLDALVHWTDALSSSYRVEWANANLATDSGQKETSGISIHLNGLTPGATYNVAVTPLSGPLVGIKQRSSLTTQTLSPTQSTRLNFTKSVYAFGEDVVLSLLDYRGQLKQITWYLDGKPTETTLLRPASGEHAVMAVVVDASGMKEYIVKYITIK